MRSNISAYRDLFVGVDYEVEKFDGEKVIPINFDNAATTPAFKVVKDNIDEAMNTYGSIGRGSGFKSIQTTEAYEHSRDLVLDFFGLNLSNEYTVIYTKNTTEGLNLLANVLVGNKSETILTTRMEHHANDLPWRNVGNVLYIDTNADGNLIFEDIEKALNDNKIDIVTVTAASNVTGYINPINEIAKLAHKYGAIIVVDAAQIIAHSKININPIEKDAYLDFVVFSGHKMYAPLGSGVIVGRKSILEDKPPFLRGGAAINIVFDYEEYWGHIPQRYEAGTQNFLGVIGLASAMAKLKEIGMDTIESYEYGLKNYIYKNIKNIPNILEYGSLCCDNRLGIISFNLTNKDHQVVARELSYLRAIAIRDGCFCSHSYVKRLLGLADDDTRKYIYDENLLRPGLVRVSFGLYNDFYEIDEFLNTLEYIATHDIIK
ncbi:MAG: aminotransferase class V-fold PLP-dependent enzyme [Sarcina sp.]